MLCNRDKEKGNYMKNWYADKGNGTYQNPILYTDYSDPDAIRVGDDYFMTASSFCNTPGLPILHSRDLVNWKVINYALENIPYDRYAKPCHGCGVWAPSIRYHEGKYIIFFPMPDEGIFVTTTDNPWGKWSEPHAIFEGKGWIDPCPLWDDDGKAYMVSAYAKSRIGFKSILHICEISPDCERMLNDGIDVFDGNACNEETIEGPKLYKRNGYYYIFAPAGGVKTGWQVVLRSKNIYGPYEHRNVLVQGDTMINGPHQGALVDANGEDYFIHFQDVYAAGRIVHMQPVKWINDWPIIGEQINEYAGQPYLEYPKPVESDVVFAPDFADDFKGDKLGLQWQWNANHQDNFYSLTDAGLRLNACHYDESESIADLPNLLLQKWATPEFDAVSEIDLSNLTEGNLAGIVSMGIVYGALAVRVKGGRKELVTIYGEQFFDKEVASSTDELSLIKEIDSNTIFMKTSVKPLGVSTDNIPKWEISLAYSLDNSEYVSILSFEAVAGRWVGVKEGLFCADFSEKNNDNAGYVIIKSHEIV